MDFSQLLDFAFGRPRTCCVDQDGLELRDPPAFASQILGLKSCFATSSFSYFSRTVIRHCDPSNLQKETFNLGLSFQRVPVHDGRGKNGGWSSCELTS